jgi:hypothetical protein
MANSDYNSYFSALQTKQISQEHPRLFGPRSRLQELAKVRPEAYACMVEIARDRPLSPFHSKTQDYGACVSVLSKLFSLSLLCAIEEDAKAGREAIHLAFDNFIAQPLAIGHVPFGGDVGMCAIVYDLCHEHWTKDERLKFHGYMFATRDANVDEALQDRIDQTAGTTSPFGPCAPANAGARGLRWLYSRKSSF